MISPRQDAYYEKLRSARREAYRLDNRQTLSYPQLIFIGDSITEWFPIADKLKPKKTWANRGIAASNSQHILDHLDIHLFGTAVTDIVLLLGTNDLGYDLPLDQTVANLTAIIEDVADSYPLATLYLLELLPVNEAEPYQGVVAPRTNRAILELNQAYAQLSQTYPHVKLVPTYAKFLDAKGQLDQNLTKDGLHLSEAGYDLLSNILHPFIS